MGIAIVYVILCFISAAAGSGKEVGYWGAFMWSMLLSPIVGLIIGLSSGEPIKVFKYTCKHCKLESKENSHYCPRCTKDSDGFNSEENKLRFAK